MYNNENTNNNINIITDNNDHENVPSATFYIERDAAIELYNFIREHLDVVNETPYAEAMMIALETTFDLGNDSEE